MTKDPLSKFPQQFSHSASSERTTTLYVRKPGYYAVHMVLQPGALAHAAVALFNEGAIAIFAASPTTDSGRGRRSARLMCRSPAIRSAVPTGLIFVRFAEGMLAASHAS